MSNKILEDLKWDYNYYLMRYEKGCKYLEKNPNVILEEIKKNTKVSDLEILKGFKLEGERNVS